MLDKIFWKEYIIIRTVDKKNEIEKLQYNVNKKDLKIALSSGKIDKYECFTSEELLPSIPSQIIQQAIFTY